MIKRLMQLCIWLGMWGVAYMLFKHGWFEPLRQMILASGYVGTFLAGIMFSYSFSVAPGAAILLLLSQHQILWLSVAIGGAGALLGDLMVFNFIRLSDGLAIEKKHHEHAGKIERGVHATVDKINKNMPKQVRKALLLTVASLIILSPLPNEVGVALAVTTTDMTTKQFFILSYLLNLAGVLALLWIGQLFI